MDIRVRASRLSVVAVATVALLLLNAVIPPPVTADPKVVYHGSRQRPWIALTIDDGYSSTNCRRIADILLARHVPATYFPYARVIRNAPATWRYISSKGFKIANHTVAHPYMTRLTYSEQLSQVKRAARILRRKTGRTMLPLFRPPYGSYNAKTLRAAGAAGIKYVVLWDTTFADTAKMSDAAHFRHAMRGTKGSIILLHCGPASSVRILPKVIKAYRARGLKFVTVERMLGLEPKPTPTPSPTPTPTPTPTPSPTPTPTPTPTPSPTPAPTSSPAPTPASSPTPTPSSAAVPG